MHYEIYSLDKSLYGKVSNNHKLIIYSKQYKHVHIMYLSESKSSILYTDVDKEFIAKHINKIFKQLQKEM